MKSTNRWNKVRKIMIICGMAAILAFALAFAQAQGDDAMGDVERVLVPAPSLANSMVGEPGRQYLYIYTPPAYGKIDRRYPVLYFINGFTAPADVVYQFADTLDDLINSEEIPPMIVVGVNGVNRLGGSFFVNSPATGNWEDFLVSDVVRYMDTNYRTIADSEARGIAGFSMGGFAALNIGLKHPRVFSTVYALGPGVFAPNGLKKALSDWHSGQARFPNAYGAAFAPNPAKPFPHADILTVDGYETDVAVREKWENGYGNWETKLEDYLKKEDRLKAIRIQYGVNDSYRWIPEGCRYLSGLMTQKGIEHELLEFEGGHILNARIWRKDIFPFFGKHFGIE